VLSCKELSPSLGANEVAKSWDQMSSEEKLDRLRFIIEDFINHYNNNVLNNNATLNAIGDRLKKIEETLNQK
jgi:hypothetical protein